MALCPTRAKVPEELLVASGLYFNAFIDWQLYSKK